MKKKHINKISKKIFDQIDRKYSISDRRNYKTEEPVAEREIIADYDEEVSKRFKKLVNNLLKYPDNISLSYNDSNIQINVSDITELKKDLSFKSSGYTNKVSDSNSLNIYIYKSDNSHFNVSQGYRRSTKYYDPTIYDDLIDIIKNKVREVNSNNFNSIYEDISRESGILRDSNLDDILG